AAIRAAWLAIAHAVAQNGRPTALLGPLAPFHFEGMPPSRWVLRMHFLLLDCRDEVRRQRSEARPPWRARDIEEQLAWASWLRGHIDDNIDTNSTSVDETAASVAAWIRTRLRL
ncbi:MAG: nucleoside kinase, partial [Chloroflexi bacterium]|nr:nucleoside kinase [Chloroflexota bacterium]